LFKIMFLPQPIEVNSHGLSSAKRWHSIYYNQTAIDIS